MAQRSPIAQLISDIKRYDARRQEVRARILEAGGHNAGSYDAELAVLNREIQRFALQINRTLEDCARRGKSPGQVSVGSVGDPELNQFLSQVKRTCAELERAQPMGGAPAAGTRSGVALARDRAEASRLRQQIKQRQRQTDDEVRKTDRALSDLDRDRKRLDDEQHKLDKQREKLEQEREKVARDLEQAQAQKQTATRDQAKLEADKKQQLQRLRALRQPSRRPHLEQEIQKINQSLARLDQEVRLRDERIQRDEKIRTSIDRELRQLDDATKRLEKERERIEEEERERLEERKEQLQKARQEDDGRLAKLDAAERQLNQATASS